MDRQTRERALRLLEERRSDPRITYADIGRETGHGRRQLMRLSKRLELEGADAVLVHGNTGMRPHNAATPDEAGILRELKRPYPEVIIARFRDIYIEDVTGNPARADEVERYGLTARSASWFRDLFARQGRGSPASRGQRRDSDGRQHPMRAPLSRAGAMAQVDGTPYDWFGDGASWCMHLAVDDATTGVLAGWFMERECARGYARMMRQVAARHGVPRSMYSYKDAVSGAKDGSPTQFALMMADLGIRMIFANSPQAKGRVERHDSTAQMRLPTDLVRFGVGGYGETDGWSDDFYAPYPDTKFSYPPRDAQSDFTPLREGVDPGRVFRTRQTRVSHGCTISCGGTVHVMVDEDGVLLEVADGTRLSVHVEAITEEMYVERSGRRWACVPVAKRGGRGPAPAQDRRQLQALLAEMQGPNAAREG